VGQTRKREDNIKELDTVVRENDIKPNQETPAAEIVRLKEAEPQNADISKEFISPPDETQITNHKPESHLDENIKDDIPEQEETVTSCESTPEVSRGSQMMAVKSLSPSPESSASPVPSTQPQLTEGSHFMCV
ncbi:pleckstrin homology domain-containing family A member 5, partial [Otolemur garnettii]|uniref:pleckstrin homology domain-containing family A member 5 n=1 Tax=Otolemur garnettii TaxID=30611 RepID=UPI0006445BD1